MVKYQQKISKKFVFVTKIPNTFDFSSQKQNKKIGHVFLGLFTLNHPYTKMCCFFSCENSSAPEFTPSLDNRPLPLRTEELLLSSRKHPRAYIEMAHIRNPSLLWPPRFLAEMQHLLPCTWPLLCK